MEDGLVPEFIRDGIGRPGKQGHGGQIAGRVIPIGRRSTERVHDRQRSVCRVPLGLHRLLLGFPERAHHQTGIAGRRHRELADVLTRIRDRGLRHGAVRIEGIAELPDRPVRQCLLQNPTVGIEHVLNHRVAAPVGDEVHVVGNGIVAVLFGLTVRVGHARQMILRIVGVTDLPPGIVLGEVDSPEGIIEEADVATGGRGNLSQYRWVRIRIRAVGVGQGDCVAVTVTDRR